MTIEERMAAKTVRTPGGCWEWTGATNPKGYGQIHYRGRLRLAHRVAWELANGQLPDIGIVICHRCDNPPCVNPEHLFSGTQKDNVQDMVSKGRARGRKRKLSDDDVVDIRRRYKTFTIPGTAGLFSNGYELAAEYGIHRQYITKLISNTYRRNAA